MNLHKNASFKIELLSLFLPFEQRVHYFEIFSIWCVNYKMGIFGHSVSFFQVEIKSTTPRLPYTLNSYSNSSP